MSLAVLRIGPEASVQDLGRPGLAHAGVPPSGAFDALSLRAANRLVANDDAWAAVELDSAGATFLAERGTLAALAGGDALAVVIHAGGRLTPLFRGTPVRPGERIHIGPLRSGRRAYLAVRGGIDVPRMLTSRSTCAPAGFGGLDGRTLRVGDRLPLAVEREPARVAPPSAAAHHWLAQQIAPGTLRVAPGPHAHAFDLTHLGTLLNESFRVDRLADRAGVRLTGSAVVPAGTHPLASIRSDAMPVGAVQVTPAGSLIIVGPDGPVTGGYPAPLVTIAADLPILAQRRPGDTLRLSLVTPASAVAAAFAQRRELDLHFPPQGRA